MKKIFAAILTAALIFSPVGNVVFQDQPTAVEAKSYKSGKKGFSNPSKSTNNNTFFQNNKQNKQDTTTNKSTTTSPKGGLFSGGLMKGLMLGGLAGLLFGGLFANMGILGSILGLMINVLAIIFVFQIIRAIFVYFMNKKKREANQWRN